MFRTILAITSILSLALCAVSTFLWIRSMLGNNYWDTPSIIHLGGLPAVFVAMLAAILPTLAGWLWYRERRRNARRGFMVLQDR